MSILSHYSPALETQARDAGSFERWLNTDWRFQRIGPDDCDVFFAPSFDDSEWPSVHLPHVAHIEALDERRPWQGICWYRRTITPHQDWAHKRVTLQFGAAMQIAEVWVNGKLRMRHLGGYLPFTIDLSREALGAEPIAIAVRLDNRDTDLVPPGKPTQGLDFHYPGGLYRGVKLIVTDALHVSDAIEANIVAGGGVFVTYEDVSDKNATIRVKTDVANDGSELARRCRVHSTLLNADGQSVAETISEPLLIVSAGHHQFEQILKVSNPDLWHPDTPYLYTLRTVVSRDGESVDEVNTKVGIRTFTLDKRLTINRREFHIRGTNRHQEYPYIEYALSPNVARRDAQLIKDGGFNHIRLSHYPQDPAFLDACDELGILVQPAVPGWQIFHNTPSFVRGSYQNIRDMIRRDRNHPSIIFWEPNLNETHGDHQDWCEAAYQIAHQEYPGDQCITFGDPYPSGWRGWDADGFIREYGDYGFGGNESTSRHTRGEGEAALLQQAWNYQWCHNDNNRAAEDPNARFYGDATWCMFDYNRGYYPKPCLCGMMDIFRLPKYVYRFFQSQRDPALLREDIQSGPMAFIASDWTSREGSSKVIVYSNCEEVALSINGKLFGRQKPDSGPDTKYSDWKADLSATVGSSYDNTGGNPFDGGNANHLHHPPFTFFDVPYEPGATDVIGYIAGKPAARDIVRTPEAPTHLRLRFDTQDIALTADGADALFVRAEIVDNHGTICPINAYTSLKFTVSGPARLIGTTPVHVEAGVASVLLQATTEPGEITVSVIAGCLPDASATIVSQAPILEISRSKNS